MKKEYLNIEISGILRLKTPLHISSPEKGYRYMPSSGRIVRAASGGFPVTVTRTEEFRSPFAVSEKNPLGRVRLPIIPARGIKGVLRRQATAIIEENFIGRGLKMKSALFHALTCGAVSGRPDGDAPDSEAVRFRSNHCFVGLFGGGTQITPGKLYASDGRVFADCYIETGTVPDGMTDVIPSTSVYGLFEAMPVIRRDDIVRGVLTERDHEALEDYDEYLLKLIEDSVKRRTSKLEGDDDSGAEQVERGVQAMSFSEVVIGGTEFYFNVGAKGVTPSQAGLLIEALGRWLATGQHGGMGSICFGKFSHDLNVVIDGKSYSGVFNHDNPDQPLCEGAPDDVLELVSASANEIDETTPDVLHAHLVQGSKSSKK